MPERIALVTGAVGIIGPGICQSLADAGWKVAAHALSDQDWAVHRKITGSEFPAALKVEGDLSSRAACQNLSAAVREQLGEISLLVNNAAFNPPPPSLETMEEKYAQSMLGINLLAPLFLVQACLGDLKKAGGASIVNIGSIQTEIPNPGQLLYPIAKAALETLTQILARDLAPYQIRCNLIRVGSVPGPAFMWSALQNLPDDQARQLHEEILPLHLNGLKDLNPTGQVTQPKHVGDLITFLASPVAAQITGATIPLDGGLSCAVQFPPRKNPAWDSAAALKSWLEDHSWL